MVWKKFCTFNLRVRGLICQDCVYMKIVVILESILGKIRLTAFIQTDATRKLINGELCKKHSQIIFVIQYNLPLQTKVNIFVGFKNKIRFQIYSQTLSVAHYCQASSFAPIMYFLVLLSALLACTAGKCYSYRNLTLDGPDIQYLYMYLRTE